MGADGIIAVFSRWAQLRTDLLAWDSWLNFDLETSYSQQVLCGEGENTFYICLNWFPALPGYRLSFKRGTWWFNVNVYLYLILCLPEYFTTGAESSRDKHLLVIHSASPPANKASSSTHLTANFAFHFKLGKLTT